MMGFRQAFIAMRNLRIAIARLEPTDVIILESPQALSDEEREHIYGVAKTVWPKHEVVVLDDGLQMKVVRGVA